MSQASEKRLCAFMPIGDLEGKREFGFRDIRNFPVMNTTGHKVGTVKDVFVDPNSLEPAFAFLQYEKFMNFNVKHLLVPWSEMIVRDQYVQTRWTEEELLPGTRAEQQRNLAQDGAGIDVSPEMSADHDMTPTFPYDVEEFEEEEEVVGARGR